MGEKKNGLVNIQKQMLERWSEVTYSEREINWDPRDENEADMQEAGSIPERQEPGRPLRSWQEASNLPVVREERVWGDEVRRSSLSGACRDLQAITESLDLIRGEVCNPWKISELCQVRQRSSSYYKRSCASSSVAESAPRYIFRKALAKFQQNRLARRGLWRQQSEEELIKE